MPSDAPTSQPSAKDRRVYYRVNTVLPISIQTETDTTEGELIEKSVNISGGGIGVTVNVVYKPDEILSITLILPDKVIFKAYAEVLRLESPPLSGRYLPPTHPFRQNDHTESGTIDQTHPRFSTRPSRKTLFRINACNARWAFNLCDAFHATPFGSRSVAKRRRFSSGSVTTNSRVPQGVSLKGFVATMPRLANSAWHVSTFLTKK